MQEVPKVQLPDKGKRVNFKPDRKFFVLVAIALLLGTIFYLADFYTTGHFEGVFLLKGKGTKRFELKDDLYLGDGSRVLFAVDFENPMFLISRLYHHHEPGKAYLDFEWEDGDGSGFVKNNLPGGRQLVTYFSRFREDSGKDVKGLFVGGGLPENVRDESSPKANQTGMAYYDGKRWYHIWCSVNEGIISSTTAQMAFPGDWKYEGSRVLNQSSQRLVIKSSHQVTIDGVPLHIDRYAYFRAGETYFLLALTIKNIGKEPVKFNYVYGDEPWLGNYGSSKGNIGWIKNRTIVYTQLVDPQKYDYAGFYDYGNSIINEGHNFTKTANFIQWVENRPKYVYYANSAIVYEVAGMLDQTEVFVPLESNTRFMGLEWGAKLLRPGESDRIVIAVGMALNDPKTDFPVKPEVLPADR